MQRVAAIPQEPLEGGRPEALLQLLGIGGAENRQHLGDVVPRCEHLGAAEQALVAVRAPLAAAHRAALGAAQKLWFNGLPTWANRMGGRVVPARLRRRFGLAIEPEIDTILEKAINSELSGNIIDLCPVGALTSSLYRFEARPWDIQNVPTVCTGCPVGCNVTATIREGKVRRILSRNHPEIDRGWL